MVGSVFGHALEHHLGRRLRHQRRRQLHRRHHRHRARCWSSTTRRRRSRAPPVDRSGLGEPPGDCGPPARISVTRPRDPQHHPSARRRAAIQILDRAGRRIAGGDTADHVNGVAAEWKVPAPIPTWKLWRSQASRSSTGRGIGGTEPDHRAVGVSISSTTADAPGQIRAGECDELALVVRRPL